MNTAAATTETTALGLGRTCEVGTVRIHRFADLFKVWDITHAGKRGKKVRVLSLSAATAYRGDRSQWMDRMAAVLIQCESFDRLRAVISGALLECPGQIEIHESEARGIDVNAAGSTKLVIATSTGLRITAEPNDFMVTHSTKLESGRCVGFNQDTLYYSRDRRAAASFYAWLRANLSKINNMTIHDLRSLWSASGVAYDYH